MKKTSGKTVNVDPAVSQQMALFPKTNPLLGDLGKLDINELSPIEALNLLFTWKKKYLTDDEE